MLWIYNFIHTWRIWCSATVLTFRLRYQTQTTPRNVIMINLLYINFMPASLITIVNCWLSSYVSLNNAHSLFEAPHLREACDLDFATLNVPCVACEKLKVIHWIEEIYDVKKGCVGKCWIWIPCLLTNVCEIAINTDIVFVVEIEPSRCLCLYVLYHAMKKVMSSCNSVLPPMSYFVTKL